jgi:sortase B
MSRKKTYYIGKFQFDSYNEYQKGMGDVKKIKYISDELDVREPGVALRLYTLIRQEDIKFQSVIGEDYLLYLSDLVADNYNSVPAGGYEANLADSGSVSTPRKIAGILCITVAVLCFLYFMGSEYINIQNTREIKDLQNNKEISMTADYIAGKITGKTEEEVLVQENAVKNEEYVAAVKPKVKKKKKAKSVILPELRDTYQRNKDLVAWITIPDTEINYPVLQSKEDNNFYLDRTIDKETNKNGSIFMDTRNNIVDRDSNLIIYGHNMKSGQMFGGLDAFEDSAYVEGHKTIQFNTLYERAEYDIIAVCLTEVAYQGDDVFRYYDYLNAENKEAFQEFKSNVERMNIYSGNETLDITMEDELITLSTCNYYTTDGRLFVLAKKKTEAGN